MVLFWRNICGLGMLRSTWVSAAIFIMASLWVMCLATSCGLQISPFMKW